jgi:hypothetical protein
MLLAYRQSFAGQNHPRRSLLHLRPSRLVANAVVQVAFAAMILIAAHMAVSVVMYYLDGLGFALMPAIR